jgi:hypothetical protein
MSNEQITAPAKACPCCGSPLTCPACNGDAIATARLTLTELMRGGGGRNAQTRLNAAKLTLADDYLAHLSDDDLRAEVRRRDAGKRR